MHLIKMLVLGKYATNLAFRCERRARPSFLVVGLVGDARKPFPPFLAVGQAMHACPSFLTVGRRCRPVGMR